MRSAVRSLAAGARRLNSRAWRLCARRRARRHARRGAPPALILVVDRARLADPLGAARRLPAGAAVLLRDYGAADRAPFARALAALCRRRRLRFLIGGDWRLAARLGAGLHMPEALARRRRGHGWRTAAAHGRAGLCRAARAGAGAALLSPVFPTASHPGAAALGPVRFAGLVRAAGLPVYALGGLDAARTRRLAGTGARGIAAIGAFGAPAGGAAL